MSAKTKIIVLHMKEVIYTIIFVVLAIGRGTFSSLPNKTRPLSASSNTADRAYKFSSSSGTSDSSARTWNKRHPERKNTKNKPIIHFFIMTPQKL